MLKNRRCQPGFVLIPDEVSLLAELVERGIHIDGVPEHDYVDDQSQGAEPVFLPLTIALPQLAIP